MSAPSLESRPPEAWQPLMSLARLAVRPLERFLRVEAASGIVLLTAAAVALVLANSPWGEGYAHFWHTVIGFRVGGFEFERPLEWLINDGLMVIFFFVVGLEIRRELHHGELSDFRRALLPAAAALGGMVVPALIYLLVAGAPQTRHGWGVPTATDIAFAVGVLTLLGKRVPPALRVLLLALAVIDDLGAIIVIGLFYSSGISLGGLGVAVAALLGIFLLQRFGVRNKAVYVLPAVVAWAGVAASGIHPTIAGVAIGLITPVTAWLGPSGFLAGMQRELEAIDVRKPDSHELSERLKHVALVRREAMSPAESLIELLHPWVAFGIMPLFALANAGVVVSGFSLEGPSARVAAGVVAGLVLGKPLGVTLACMLLVKTRLASLPVGLSLRHVLVLGTTAGIGFTMSLFVAQLAFDDAAQLSAAKMGVLAATGVASLAALCFGALALRPAPGTAAQSADEAEASTTH